MVSTIAYSSLTNHDLLEARLTSTKEIEWAEEVNYRLRNNLFEYGEITGEEELKIFCNLWPLGLYPKWIQMIAQSCTIY